MSDKGFGDHANRNIVKNPLLSTAVTGLSLEDLTHNAVLLPAAPTQGLNTRSEHQIGAQHQPLGYSDHEPANQPSGDSISLIQPPHHSTTTLPPLPDSYVPVHHDIPSETSTCTQSKALPKSEDHFDVNEYFARLQGTRYVSAPLNSQLPDKNANLSATEDNLEEINLNDDKPEVQHSLTSDIAQNFSQLPTVLPHVASAVFSSFSSMLSMKSREVTPDEGKGNRGVVEETVPLMGVAKEVKEVAPPPKEPPVSGPGNYRITSKKKYAQIPGLSSFDTQPTPYNPISSAHPSYFTPKVQDSTVNFFENITTVPGDNTNDGAKPIDNFNMFNIENVAPLNVNKLDDKPTDSYATVCNPSYFQSNVQTDIRETELSFPEQQTTVILPPPMFSTHTRDQTTGKSVLPPSVARRIGSNHPFIKQQTMQAATVGNIFVPTFDAIPTEASEAVRSQAQMFDPQTLETNEPTLQNSPPTKPSQTSVLQQPISAPINQPPSNVQSAFAATTPSDAKIFTPYITESALSLTNIFTPPSIAPSLTNVFTPPSTALSMANVFTPPSQAPLANIFTPTLPPTQSQPMTSMIPQASSIFMPQSASNISQSVYNPIEMKPEPSQSFVPPSEPTKPLAEPPKATGGVSYRMAKKRPQYYSGPIEGLGAISNNSKPVLPPVETDTFQGALFTPDQGTASPNTGTIPFDINQQPAPSFDTSTNQAVSTFDITQTQTNLDSVQNTASMAFDITTPADLYADVKPQEQNMPTYHDTAFDLSRPTTEAYYEESKESKGFGIIGSLKSKLSAIDINKIQNTVTTFFDPGYNESKKEDTHAPETEPYRQMHQQDNFEVCVPNIPGSQTYLNQNVFQDNQYYNEYNCPNQGYSSYYTNPGEYSNYLSYGQSEQHAESNLNTNIYGIPAVTNVQEQVQGNVITSPIDQHVGEAFDDTKNNMQENRATVTSDGSFSSVSVPQNVANTESFNMTQNVTFDDSSARMFFDTNQSQPIDSSKSLKDDKKPFDIVQVSEKSSFVQQVDTFAPIPFEQRQEFPATIQKPIIDPTSSFNKETKPTDLFSTKASKQDTPRADNLLESITKDEIPIVGVSSVPLFGLSTMITDKSKEITDASIPLFDADAPNFVFDRKASLFGPVEPEGDENVSELSICETCREFSKPEDKDNDDLTTHLIDNITSPIQLSNAVEVPLTEPNVAADDNAEFDNNQCEEITHMTEETIERIQEQSATELLDDVETLPPRNYDWATEEEYPSLDKRPEDDYTFKIDPNTLGFYGNNSLFFDNVTNASDEIKAELQHHEEYPKISIPSAPPAEDDTKSDETGGLDVHSIEQDAKKDFPIYEEFVIEPSETDDDKIEYKERERTDSQESDTFTNRVERFKKMEEVDDEQRSIFELSSPPISMASYFDTGNFAVDTHYRNSLTSPSQVRIPPGFEEEFQNRLIVSRDLRTVPDTSTQTRTTQALTQSTSPISSNGTVLQTPFVIPNTSTQTKTTEALTLSSPNASTTITKPGIPFVIPNTSTQTKITQGLTLSVANTTQSFSVPRTQTLAFSIPNPSTQTKTTQDLTFSGVQNIGRVGYADATLTKLGDDNVRMSDFSTFGSEESDVIVGLPNILTSSIVDDIALRSNEGGFLSTASNLFFASTDNDFSKVLGLKGTDDILTNIGGPGAQFSRTIESNEDHTLQTRTIGLFASVKDGHKDMPGLATGVLTESDRPIFGTPSNIADGLRSTNLFASFSKEFETRDVSPLADIPISLLPSCLIEETGLDIKLETKKMDPFIKADCDSKLFDEQQFSTPFNLKYESNTNATQLFDKTTKLQTNIAEHSAVGAQIEKHTERTEPITLTANLFGTFEPKYDMPQSGFGLKEEATPITTTSELTTKTDKLPDFCAVFGSTANTGFGVKEKEMPINTIATTSKLTTKTDKLPDFCAVFGSTANTGFGVKEKEMPINTIASELTTKTDELPEFGAVGGTTAKTETSLPDPINFFSSETPAEPAEGFNRLASYFSTPPKTDHAKSFFELSQSENHYRHPINPDYVGLMKDLTSPQHLQVSKDETFKHVNYFTVEHDAKKAINLNVEYKDHFNRHDTENILNKIINAENSKEQVHNKSNNIISEHFKDDKVNKAKELDNLNRIKHLKADREIVNSKTAEIDYFNETIKIFGECDNCGINVKDYKFRCFMDSNGETDRNNINMDKDSEDRRRAVSVNFEGIALHEEANEGVSVLSEGRSSPDYSPVKHHWFYRVDVEGKSIWRGFSLGDSRALEVAYLSPELDEATLVATDGGRYDVNIMGRLRIPVYWDDKPTNVRRCSWFYKGTTDARYVPYTEQVADKLEEEYRHGVTRGEWHRRLCLPNGEVVVMHGPGVMVHFLHSSAADSFSGSPLFTFGKRVYRNPPKIRASQDQPLKIDHLILFVHGAGEYRSQKDRRESTSRPRVVRRGHDESEIEDPEPSSIDHLLLLCHGVGSACDMRFRSVEEVVEDFRATSLQLLQSHYRNSYDKGVVSRIEVLPISWHSSLHSGETGVDRRLAQITLDSIPRLRHFTNDTLLDVLFYTSPVFCQTIIDTVCRELNRIYSLFKQRNPNFQGGISLGGHSLGSVILYDLLCNQIHGMSTEEGNVQSKKTYVTGTNRIPMQYPKLDFNPDSLYALGSPIAIFECIRGVESLGLNFDLPTCKNFFNIFHPYDPIAYRIEPLINPLLRDLKPLLIPHHKGRKRMHLELKDTMARVGADLKQKLLESLKTTWNKWKAQPSTNGTNGQLPNVLEEEIEKEPLTDDSKEELARDNALSTPEMLGRLNGGRRIDYVLQEAPLEMINEYIFAMSSHVGYWESEDTMLLILREIYGALGVQPDCTVPQQSMTVQRARTPRQDETLTLNSSEYPSTSHGAI